MSLQFLTLEIGGPNLTFNESGNVATVPFMFPLPAVSAYALLQGFDLEFNVPDNELDSIAILPSVHFGVGDRSGTVELRFSMVGDSIHFSWEESFEDNRITGHIKLLIVGSDEPLDEPIIPRGQVSSRPSKR